MVWTGFDPLIETVRAHPVRRRMVVAAAGETHTLEAALHARREGLAEPVLVGDGERIAALLAELGADPAALPIHTAPDPAAACALAVRLVREGRGDFLMKGFVDTKVLLGAVVNRELGLGIGGLMSHLGLFEVPTYHKLLAVVDGGMIPYPTLEQKQGILENTVAVFHRLGCETPKVGVLACVEKVNPKMPETVEAAELEARNRRGEIANCLVSGPISYDCAVSGEIAALKGYTGAAAGDADILLAPNIHTGNIIGKLLTVTCGARMAGIVAGAACPIVLTSRGSTAEEKFLSIALSAAVSG